MKKVIILSIVLAVMSSIHCSEKAANDLARAQQKIEKRERERSKEIRFSDHAREQMAERGISRSEVEKTIEYGTRSVNKRDKSVKFLRNNIMVVMDLDQKTVITVYSSKKKETDILTKKQRAIRAEKERDKGRSPTYGLSKETKSLIRTGAIKP